MGTCVNTALTKVDSLEAKEATTEHLFRALENRIGETRAGAEATDKTARYLYTRVEGWEATMGAVKGSLDSIQRHLSQVRCGDEHVDIVT